MPLNITQELPTLWKSHLTAEFEKDYMQRLSEFLRAEKGQVKSILPHSSLWFNALTTTDLDQVKVVILGQDPYPTPGHAHGLCFSVMPEVKPIPKSLINIYKELEDDLSIVNSHGNLQSWAEQGVLLLNSVLTVEVGKANSHQGQGWEQLTDRIIEVLNEQASPIAFVLWGAYAQKKGSIVSNPQHLVLRSPHPSPLSAYRGFFGSKPFSKINDFLTENGKEAINWKV
ncbi:MAG: uracil-DNA glycosylase [Gammaproteobacteria bacterium]|nr:MAG: uracil-DNA glycosylase [Gammaproteobacteria bacterium]